MEFPTFYSYFLYTKNWAYIMMIVVLPLYVAYCLVLLFVLFCPLKRNFHI